MCLLFVPTTPMSTRIRHVDVSRGLGVFPERLLTLPLTSTGCNIVTPCLLSEWRRVMNPRVAPITSHV